MITERDLYKVDWQQVADYVDPYAGRYLKNQTGPQKLPSRSKVINSEATDACRTMDAGFMGGHTSKSRPWFIVKISDARINELPDVRAWCDDLTTRIRDVLAGSNFYTELPRFYHSRHLFGVAALAVDEDDKDSVRFYSRNIGTYAFALDARGICDSFWYSFQRTANQIKAQYRDDGIPTKVRQALADGKGDTKFTIESLIEPNPDARSGVQGSQFRAFRQLFWIEGTDSEEHGCLKLAGHYEMPVKVSRYDATGSDCYGPSPALDVLGDIKQLQYLEGEKLRLIDLMSKPALKLPDYLRNKGASLNPGERIFVSPMQTQQQVEPVYTPDPRGLAAVQAEIDKVTARIQRAFKADLFRMLDFLDDRQRTAFEVSERKEEKVAMLGPALESLTDEVLQPTIERVFAIEERNGNIAPPPRAMAGMPLTIEYTSMLAQAMKAAGLGTIERTVGFVAGLFQATGGQRADVFDKLDFDQAIDEFADRAGSPARLVRSDDEVAAIRESRAQQQQAMAMAQMAPALKQGADAVRSLGEAVPKPGSALESLGELA